VAQEAWLRWTNVDASEVANPRAFLLRVTSRLAIERLRRLKTRRGSYVGPWLPEPVLAGRRGPRPGVTLIADGDRVRAPLRPVRGADKVVDS
jgi:RNA polymerase sigma-70 factor (ECF subfamily)